MVAYWVRGPKKTSFIYNILITYILKKDNTNIAKYSSLLIKGYIDQILLDFFVYLIFFYFLIKIYLKMCISLH